MEVRRNNIDKQFVDKEFGYFVFGGALLGAILGLAWSAGNPVGAGIGALIGTAIGWFAAAARMENQKKKQDQK